MKGDRILKSKKFLLISQPSCKQKQKLDIFLQEKKPTDSQSLPSRICRKMESQITRRSKSKM